MILICNIEPYDYKQKVILANDGYETILDVVGEVDLTALPEFITSYSHKNNINKVVLYGNNQYNQMVMDQIVDCDNLMFKNYEPIEVEVI